MIFNSIILHIRSRCFDSGHACLSAAFRDDFVLKFLGSEPALPFSHFAFLAGNGQDVAM